MESRQDVEHYIERLIREFPFFLTELWREVNLPDVARHQVDMAEWLQVGPRRRGVKAFRGASKTWVTIAYCLWRLFTDNNDRIMLVSKSESHSKSSLYMARQWIKQVPFLQHLSPNKKAGQRDSATMFDIGPAPDDRTPSFSAYGVQGQITGARSSCIVSDDVETMENTLTLDMRNRLREQVKEFENVLIPNGDILILGTPHHEETLLDKLADEAGYEFRSWPARIPKDDEVIDQISPMYDTLLGEGAERGSSVWPERFDDQELKEREISEGRSTFAMQYMLQSHLGDDIRYPLRLKDLIVFPCGRDKAPVTIAWGTSSDRGKSTRCEDIPSLGFGSDGLYSPIMFDERWTPYIGTKMAIDPAGRGADKTAYAVVSYLNGYLWVKAVGGLDGGYSDIVLEGLAHQARTHGATDIVLETNFGQGMFGRLLEPVLQRFFVEPGNEEFPGGWKASLSETRAKGQKEIRLISACEAPMNQHRVIFHPDVASNLDLQRQMTRVTRMRNCLRHDDELDALSMAIDAWTNYMDTDPSKHASSTHERYVEEQLQEQYASCGLRVQKPRWFTHHGPR